MYLTVQIYQVKNEPLSQCVHALGPSPSLQGPLRAIFSSSFSISLLSPASDPSARKICGLAKWSWTWPCLSLFLPSAPSARNLFPFYVTIFLRVFMWFLLILTPTHILSEVLPDRWMLLSSLLFIFHILSGLIFHCIICFLIICLPHHE